MRFDWSKYIEVAEHLANGASERCDAEACYRSSISRSYYAAFCMVSDFVYRTDNMDLNAGDAHKKVREHFKRSGDKIKKRIANQLQDLHFERIRADYRNDGKGIPTMRSIAKKSIVMSKKILEELETLNSDSDASM